MCVGNAGRGKSDEALLLDVRVGVQCVQGVEAGKVMDLENLWHSSDYYHVPCLQAFVLLQDAIFRRRQLQ